MNKGMDAPILFETSEDLYMNNLIEKERTKDSMFIDKSLYQYFSFLSSTGKMLKNEDRINNVAVFTSINKDNTIIVRIPEA